MISSGKKRGLAAVAVSALAVTGIPFIASSASASPVTEFQLGYQGPTLDAAAADAVGGQIVLKVKGAPAGAELDLIKVANTALTGDPDSPTQDVDIVGTPTFAADDASNRFGGLDGYGELTVSVAVNTPAPGGAFAYALYFDNDDQGDVDAADPRIQITGNTTGPATSLSVSPVSQSVPANTVATYTLTAKDASGNQTQLLDGESITATPDAGASLVGGVVDTKTGLFIVNASSATEGLYSIGFDGPGSVDATAQLDVIPTATGIAVEQVDVVTGKDDRDGFGKSSNAVTVRADQSTVRLDINAGVGNANKTVSIKATGADGGDAGAVAPSFGGKADQTLTTVLDGSGRGSITFVADAGTVGNGDTVAFSGSIATITATFENATVDTVKADAAKYLSAFGGTVAPSVTVTDQFGDPVTGVYVDAQRTGPTNTDTAPTARQQVDASGKASFTFTDTKATAASHADDTIAFNVYAGTLDATPLASTTSKIGYSADGLGADFAFTVNNRTPAGTAYDPNNTFAVALTDANANLAAEFIDLDTTGGTADAALTVSVDNGALVLPSTASALSEGKTTLTGETGDSFKIIGTTAGLVNVTVTSGGRTHTAQVSVHTLSQDAQDATDLAAAARTARNLTVTAPESAASNEVVEFTVTATDAFGNPVAGVTAADLGLKLTGPADITDVTATDKSGVSVVEVELDSDADSPVKLTVDGANGTDAAGAQFGAAANRLSAASVTDNAAGLPASSDKAEASISDVVNIAALQAAVDAAQAKVTLAQSSLTAAQGELDVAKTERRVANRAVKAAKKDVRKAKRAVKKAPKAKKAAKRAQLRVAKRDLREARGDKKIAKTKVKAKRQVAKNAQTALENAQAELEAAQQALEDAQSPEEPTEPEARR